MVARGINHFPEKYQKVVLNFFVLAAVQPIPELMPMRHFNGKK